MNTKPLVVAKINFRNIRLAYILTIIMMAATLIQNVVFLILLSFGIDANGPDNMTVSWGNYLFIFIILSAIFIASKNFRKMMNLGGKRSDFFKGCLVNYAIMSAIVSLVCVIMYYTYDKYMVSVLYGGGSMDVLYWFGWLGNGAVVAFFRLFVFLLLLASVVHTLTAAQEKWYGWAADVLIVAIISVFTPIATLRPALVWFFNMIIFHSSALVQIASCLVLTIAVYALNKPILARRAI